MLQPLLAASWVIQLHLLAAVLALGLGLAQFSLERGSPLHRRSGWLWVGLMTITAGSSLFIHEIRMIGIWSPIHLLSLFTLAMLVLAVRAARRHDVRVHRRTMISLFVFALIGAGAFAFMPGRLLHQVAFGS
ncbi:DUF2306 domain-containing protein [Salinisphaera aquimarina]|uniref:DUF2306 domain-containing protein n=1 Tax=Salinisphaera aquimarina TaxID=2094031 RepID=A0ABV7EW25_9GAMM